MNWIRGRIGDGYSKLKLWSFYRFDAWILKYPPGSHTGEHLDSVPTGYKHYRLNIVLRKAEGKFFGADLFHIGDRVILFRPDKMWHSARNEATAKHTRYVLSVGWLTRDKRSSKLAL
jgi:hypothetical protein